MADVTKIINALHASGGMVEQIPYPVLQRKSKKHIPVSASVYEKNDAKRAIS
ncbi:MAG: hypothetical protein JJE42_08180 [Burkholderiales bacterium]|nr:hypothetical protein [Burkholderiales bacterium]